MGTDVPPELVDKGLLLGLTPSAMRSIVSAVVKELKDQWGPQASGWSAPQIPCSESGDDKQSTRTVRVEDDAWHANNGWWDGQMIGTWIPRLDGGSPGGNPTRTLGGRVARTMGGTTVRVLGRNGPH